MRCGAWLGFDDSVCATAAMELPKCALLSLASAA
eukprot:CAMPEP_0182616142 /NCGR_PEP_ID=MMETSP1330-20130603/37263_1 /TAXON_ID=464278 /ORGANISM="Picochlorum sp., Strain RCC944" /LENGTH=33 /DNA_ID= /DNA_START= /DNA_END= /DNA_ORIENTATION=